MPYSPRARIPTLLLTAAAAVVVVLTLARVVVFWRSQAYLDTVAGVWTAVAMDLADGVVYRPLSGPAGFGGTRYFLLHPMLQAAVFAVTGDPIRSGQIVAAISVSMLVLGVYLVVRALGSARLLAACSAASVLASQTTQHALLSIRGDALPAALNMLGLALCVRQNRRPARGTDGHGLLRAGVRFQADGALGCARCHRVACMLEAPKAGDPSILGDRIGHCRRAHHDATGDTGPRVGNVAAERHVCDGRPGQPPHGAPEIRAGCAAGARDPCLHPARVRGDARLLCAGAIDLQRLGPCLCVRAPGVRADLRVSRHGHQSLGGHRRGGGRGSRQLDSVDERRGVRLRNRHAGRRHAGGRDVARLDGPQSTLRAAAWHFAETLALIPNRQRPILAENPLVPIAAGQRPYMLDPFMFRVLRESNPLFDEPLRRGLRYHAFSAVVLERNPHDERGVEWYKSAFFGAGFIEALEESYQQSGHVGMRVVYTPKDP